MITGKRLKRWTGPALSLALLAPVGMETGVSAASETPAPIRLVVDGKEIGSDVSPLIRDDRVTVPIRWVVEALGLRVEWDEVNRIVFVDSPSGWTDDGKSAGDGVIRLVVRGREIRPDVPPFVLNGRTMVPLRVIAEALGAQVDWSAVDRTVTIRSASAGWPAESSTIRSVKVTDAHKIDREKTAMEERYAHALRVTLSDLENLIEYDDGIERRGTTFVNTLTISGSAGNRHVRIGVRNGEGVFDLTALNGSSGEVGVHIRATVDVGGTTNGMYVMLKDHFAPGEGDISPRRVFDWRNYDGDEGRFDTVIELSTTLWDVDAAYIDVLLPYQSSITIHEIFLYVEKEVPGFGDMHERITGGSGASPENVHLVRNADDFARALDRVRAARAPSILYIDGVIEGGGVVTIGSDVRDLSIIGVADRGILDGTGLKIHGHNIIVENLTIQYVRGKDGIEINNATDVWVRHNTFVDGGRDLPEGVRFDEFMSVKNNAQYVIISWNHFKNGNRVLLVGSNDEFDAMPDRRIIMHHNFIENVTQRVPLYRGGHGHFYNNYVKDVNLSAANVRSNAKLRLENNYFENVRNPIGDFYGGIPGRYEVRGNLYVNCTGSQPIESTIEIRFRDYRYQLDPVERVPDIVRKGAGAGKIQQDLSLLKELQT